MALTSQGPPIIWLWDVNRASTQYRFAPPPSTDNNVGHISNWHFLMTLGHELCGSWCQQCGTQYWPLQNLQNPWGLQLATRVPCLPRLGKARPTAPARQHQGLQPTGYDVDLGTHMASCISENNTPAGEQTVGTEVPAWLWWTGVRVLLGEVTSHHTVHYKTVQ